MQAQRKQTVVIKASLIGVWTCISVLGGVKISLVTSSTPISHDNLSSPPAFVTDLASRPSLVARTGA